MTLNTHQYRPLMKNKCRLVNNKVLLIIVCINLWSCFSKKNSLCREDTLTVVIIVFAYIEKKREKSITVFLFE